LPILPNLYNLFFEYIVVCLCVRGVSVCGVCVCVCVVCVRLCVCECVRVVCDVCVFDVCGVCFLIYLLHSVPHYIVIFHDLHNLSFN